jgi:hypothetical protein
MAKIYYQIMIKIYRLSMINIKVVISSFIGVRNKTIVSSKIIKINRTKIALIRKNNSFKERVKTN